MNKMFKQHYHVYHQYIFTKKYHLYHTFDWINKTNIFSIDHLSPQDEFFLGHPIRYSTKMINGIPQTIVDEKNFLQSYFHEIGLKGDIKNWFYLFFYKKNKIKYHYSCNYGKKQTKR